MRNTKQQLQHGPKPFPNEYSIRQAFMFAVCPLIIYFNCEILWGHCQTMSNCPICVFLIFVSPGEKTLVTRKSLKLQSVYSETMKATKSSMMRVSSSAGTMRLRARLHAGSSWKARAAAASRSPLASATSREILTQQGMVTAEPHCTSIQCLSTHVIHLPDSYQSHPIANDKHVLVLLLVGTGEYKTQLGELPVCTKTRRYLCWSHNRCMSTPSQRRAPKWASRFMFAQDTANSSWGRSGSFEQSTARQSSYHFQVI